MKTLKIFFLMGLGISESFGSPIQPQPICAVKAHVLNVERIKSSNEVNIEVLQATGELCNSYKDKLLKKVLIDNGNPKKGDVIDARIQFSGDEFGSGYRIQEWTKKP